MLDENVKSFLKKKDPREKLLPSALSCNFWNIYLNGSWILQSSKFLMSAGLFRQPFQCILALSGILKLATTPPLPVRASYFADGVSEKVLSNDGLEESGTANETNGFTK